MDKETQFNVLTDILNKPNQLVSGYSVTAKKIIEPLKDSGVLGVDKPGRGQRLLVLQEDKLRSIIEHCRPVPVAVDESLPDRAKSAYRYGDSKRNAQRDKYILLLKQVELRESMIFSRDDGMTLDVKEQCSMYDLSVLGITPGDSWISSESLGLVENQDFILHPEVYLYGDQPNAIHWYGGNISDFLLNWLSERNRVSKLILYPDFDYVGFRNVCRVYEKLESQYGIEVPLPENFESYFQRQASLGKLLIENKDMSRLAEKGEFVKKYESLSLWLSYMEKYSVGVEQEMQGVRESTD